MSHCIIPDQPGHTRPPALLPNRAKPAEPSVGRLEQQRFRIRHRFLLLRLDQAHYAANANPNCDERQQQKADQNDAEHTSDQAGDKANPERADQIGEVRCGPAFLIVTLPHVRKDNADKAGNASDKAGKVAERDDGGLIEVKPIVG